MSRRLSAIYCKCGSKSFYSDATLLRIYCKKCKATIYSDAFNRFYLRGLEYGKTETKKELINWLGIK